MILEALLPVRQSLSEDVRSAGTMRGESDAVKRLPSHPAGAIPGRKPARQTKSHNTDSKPCSTAAQRAERQLLAETTKVDEFMRSLTLLHTTR
jgi:hypothetical protein